jgi:hypothetical protein
MRRWKDSPHNELASGHPSPLLIPPPFGRSGQKGLELRHGLSDLGWITDDLKATFPGDALPFEQASAKGCVGLESDAGIPRCHLRLPAWVCHSVENVLFCLTYPNTLNA